MGEKLYRKISVSCQTSSAWQSDKVVCAFLRTQTHNPRLENQLYCCLEGQALHLSVFRGFTGYTLGYNFSGARISLPCRGSTTTKNCVCKACRDLKNQDFLSEYQPSQTEEKMQHQSDSHI